MIASPATSSTRDADPHVASFGLGASALGNLFVAMSDADARRVVDRMWTGGVRDFDTAPHYGLGLSERRLGRALSGRSRDAFRLSTKVGRVLEPDPHGAARNDDEGFAVPASWRRRWDFTRDGVRRSIDDSLTRLGLDRLDTVYLHDPESHLDEAISQALPALADLRDTGEIGAIGVGSKDSGAITRIIETGAIDTAMVAGRFTLLEQPALADVLPAAEAHGVDVVAAGVFNSGILATDSPGAADRYEYGSAPRDVIVRAQALARFCRARGIALPQAALHFPLRHRAVTQVMVGIGTPIQVPQTLGWIAAPPDEDFWAELAVSGLLVESRHD